MDDDEVLATPDRVSWSVAAGVWPLPLLAVYAMLFLAHGLIYPVQPPDIGNSQAAEATAGFVALLLMVIGAVSIMWFLNRRRRWPFVLVQVGTLGAAIFFLVDPRTQSWAIPFVLALTSLTAIVLAFAPESAAYVGSGVAWPWARSASRPEPKRTRPARHPTTPSTLPPIGQAAERDPLPPPIMHTGFPHE